MLNLIILHFYIILRRLYFILLTLPRDIKLIYSLGRAIFETKRLARNKATLVSEFKKKLKENPSKICFYYKDDVVYTMKDIDIYSNKIAHILQDLGLKKHDVIALLCENRPEYIGVWLGAAKLGVVSALINTNLKKQPLIHSINTVQSKAIVISSTYYSAIEEIIDSLEGITLYMIDDVTKPDIINLHQLMVTTQDTDVQPSEPLNTSDNLLYIYTSGTTGLPKAAIMPHFRVLLGAQVGKYLLSLGNKDVIYNCLPMYHSAGGLIGSIPPLMLGATTAIRTKFSASNYFADCAKYKCNSGLYIGEMCRYLLATKESSIDYNHQVEKMIGVGMRGDIWKQFVQRFHVNKIIEFYGATEGNANIVNTDNTTGAVGIIPTLLPTFMHPVAIVKYDLTLNQPIRGPNGFCIRCKYGEPGMIIGVIKQSDPTRHFYGYADKKESQKKILENVFKKGDKYFLSGDIMIMDELGYLYFKDRTGDTFRWKGENVSTMEVETVISKYLPYTEFTVYGVKVGNLDGRVGMLAIVDTNNEVDLSLLIQGLDNNLPVYARPLFVRIMKSMAMTGTFKIKKVELQNEGFDFNKISDNLYFRQGNKFVQLDNELYENIINGNVKI